MKQKFRDQKITAYRASLIGEANEILEEYKEQGYRLTLRQLYYQLVARGLISNEVREYSKLSKTLVIGRMNGLIDWNVIEDRLRTPYLTYSVDSIHEAMQDTINYYKLDRQEGQFFHIELWTEKDAVSNILKKSSQYFHIRLLVNRGYSSCSAMYEAYRRMTQVEKPIFIIYIGDFDPSGLDMIRDINDRLDEFGVKDFNVLHIALTMDQIEKYRPPPNPAKITDPRANWYISEHGDKSWELDALKPDILHEITQNSILANLDILQFKKILNKEEQDKAKLKRMIGQI